MNTLQEAATRYATDLDRAAEYLQARGIDRQVAESAMLGYVARPIAGHEHLVGRLSIAYTTRAGVVSLKFRCIEDHNCKEAGHQRYLAFTGREGKPRLYNVNSFFAPSRVIGIAEGELDALVLSHYAGVPAVGCPGVSTWQPHFPRCFAGYDLVVVFADGDKPGRDFARMVVKELPQARAVFLPDDMDVNDVYLAEGGDGLRERAGL